MAKLNECLMIWEDERGSNQWSAMAFDGVKVETHTGENIVTAYPVSSGFNVSEHTIRQNSKIQLDAVISNISMPTRTVRQSFETAFEGLCSAAGGNADLKSASRFGRLKYDNDKIDLFDNPFGDIADNILNALTAEVSMEKVDGAFNEIVRLTRTGTIVHLLTMRGMYLNCILRNYAAANDVTNAYSLPVTLTIEQMVVISDVKDGGSILSTMSNDNGQSVFDDLLGGIFG